MGTEISGVAGYHHLCMPRMAELTQSLYVSPGSIQLLLWSDSEQRVFESLKKAFISAPALTSPPPDISKSFNLYVSENQSITKRSLPRFWGLGRGQSLTYPKDLVLFLRADRPIGQFPLQPY